MAAMVTVMAARSAMRAARGIRIRVAAARPGGIRPVVNVQCVEGMIEGIVRVMRVPQGIHVQGVASVMQRITKMMAMAVTVTGDCCARSNGIGQGIFLAGIHHCEGGKSSKQKELLHVISKKFFKTG